MLKTDDEQLVDILERIFQVNPLKRPTADRILNHPFIAKFRGKVE
jgi:serine/threonine protein kinase